MQGFGGQKTHIIEDTNRRLILRQLQALGIESAHVTNGTYMLPRDKLAPSFLAAYKRVIDLKGDMAGPLLIAANSDKSMLDTYASKPNREELVANLVPQEIRLSTVVSLASELFPDRTVVGVFYDEDTPKKLYGVLKAAHPSFATLHKTGYGTSPDDKPIVGAKQADWVFACPLFYDAKPVMHADTRNFELSHRVPDVIEDLTTVIGPHGQPYITKQGGLLFPLPASLMQYAAPSNGGPKPEDPQA